MPIRLALAAKSRVLDRLVQVISLERDFKVIARAATGNDALEAVQRRCPDILVLDMRIAGRDALSVLGQLRKTGKGSLRTPTVAVAETDGDVALEALRLGARGLVFVDTPPTQLVQCIREVHAGGKWCETAFAINALYRLLRRDNALAEVTDRLSKRQLEVARLVAKGLRNAEVAERLSIAEGTAKLHAHQVYRKLKLRGRMALKDYLQSKGL